MEEQNYIVTRISALKENYPILKNEQDYHLFIMMCLKYYYFSEPGVAFDPEMILQEYITDGGKDGGIDALFNDPTSENNDMVIVQCKFYQNSALTEDDISTEITKISNTLSDFQACRYSDYNERVVSAYTNARSQMADDGEIKIVVFTAYQPTDKRARNRIEKYVRNSPKVSSQSKSSAAFPFSATKANVSAYFLAPLFNFSRAVSYFIQSKAIFSASISLLAIFNSFKSSAYF